MKFNVIKLYFVDVSFKYLESWVIFGDILACNECLHCIFILSCILIFSGMCLGLVLHLGPRNNLCAVRCASHFLELFMGETFDSITSNDFSQVRLH